MAEAVEVHALLFIRYNVYFIPWVKMLIIGLIDGNLVILHSFYFAQFGHPTYRWRLIRNSSIRYYNAERLTGKYKNQPTFIWSWLCLFVLDSNYLANTGLGTAMLVLYCRPTFHDQVKFLNYRFINNGCSWLDSWASRDWKVDDCSGIRFNSGQKRLDCYLDSFESK